jgi:hypothetical protein
MARVKRKQSKATKKRLRNRQALMLYEVLRQKGVKDPHLYVTSLIREIEERCPEYYSATTDQQKREVLERYRVEDEALGLVC